MFTLTTYQATLLSLTVDALLLLGVLIMIEYTLFTVLLRMLSVQQTKAVLWLGVLVHELWHLITGLLIFQPLRSKLNMFTPGSKALGDVTFVYMPSPLKTLLAPLVAFAPLYGGVGLLLLFTIWLSDTSLIALFQTMPSAAQLNDLITYTFTHIIYHAPWWQSGLILYVMSSISLCMIPSSTDCRYALRGLLAWAGLITLAIALTAPSTTLIMDYVIYGVSLLATGLSLTLTLSLIGAGCALVIATPLAILNRLQRKAYN